MNDISESFWDKLKKIYFGHENGETEWKDEEPYLCKILPAIQEELSGWYEIDSPIDRGGAGLVVRLVDIRLARATAGTANSPTIYRALKIPRPISEREGLLIAMLNKEASFLASLTHSNVIKIYTFGTVKVEEFTFPYYVMDYIQDAMSPVAFAALENTTLADDMLRIFSDMLDGYCYLTEFGVRHNDPKPDNVLVDKKGRGIISDLGSAKRFNSNDASTIIPFTRRYASNDKRQRATGPATDDDRVRLAIAPNDIPIEWDIYSVGLSFYEILEAFCKTHLCEMRNPRSKYINLYLRLLIGRMLGKDILESQMVLSMPKCFYDQLHYVNFKDTKHDLDKLMGRVSLADLVPELDMDSKRVVQCPMSGTVPITNRLSCILEHPTLRRLMSVTQLGLLAYIYPNATHSRYEHSLGAYGNAVRMLHALWNDQQNPIFRLIMSKAELEACLLTVLLHDLGQYPLAHDLEEAYPELFQHEELSMKFLDTSTATRGNSIAVLIDSLWGAGTAARVKQIFSASPNLFRKPIVDRILHTIVDGPLDADKLDYIARDSSRLNIPYGLVLDYERIINSLTVVHERQGDDFYAVIGIHEKGRIGAECVAFARYALFAAVYWHHTSRAIKAMIHRAVWGMSLGNNKKVVREQFRKLLLKNKLPAVQATMFADQSKYCSPTWPGVAPTDLHILLWIRQSTSPAGQKLIDGLIQRKLFKRALVVAGEKQANLIKPLQKLRRQSEGVGESMKRLDRLLAEKIATHLQNLTPQERNVTDAFSSEISQSFMDRVMDGDILVVVDVPKSDMSKLDELRCLPEADRWKPATENTKPVTLQDSPVWSSLVKSFGAGASKIRVFVHPDWADTVRNIPRKGLEGMLSASITEVSDY